MNLDTPLPVDQAVRDYLLSCFDRNFLVEASAGSGKTTVLVERLVQMLAQGACKVGEIAALTFTRKAAGEMRSRFFVRLETARRSVEDPRQRKRLGEAIEQVHHAYIGTIHGFCSRLLREFTTEAGLPMHFSEVDEEDELQAEVWDLWLKKLSDSNHPIIQQLKHVGLQPEDLHTSFKKFSQFSDVAEWPTTITPEPAIDGLRERLSSYVQEMAVLAPHLPAEAGDSLMQKYRRMPRLLVPVQWHEKHHVFQHLEEYKTIQTVTAKRRWPGGPKQCDAEQERWNRFCEEVTEPLLTSWRAYRYPLVIRFLQQAEQFYRQERRRRAVLTFQDLLHLSVELVRSNAQVRRQLGQQWKRMLIDEFQDTDPLQAELLFLMTAQRATGHWLQASPRPGSLLLVGDPKQSIYRFRRADIQVYQLVKQRLEETGGEVVQLTVNFRSQPALVDWINTTFEKQFGLGPPGTQVDYFPMEPGRSATQPLDQCLRYLEFADDLIGRQKEDASYAESEAIARYIEEACAGQLVFTRTEAERKRGVPDQAVPGDFMILTSQRDRLQQYGETLTQWGIANQVSGGSQLNAFPGIRLLYLLLKAVSNPADQVALVGLLRSELCGLSDAQLFAYRQAQGHWAWNRLPDDSVPQAKVIQSFYTTLQTLAHDLTRMPVMAALERTILQMGFPLWARSWGDTGLGCLDKALMYLGDMAGRTRRVDALLLQLEKLLNRQPRRDGMYLPSQEGVGVRIMNLHKAKGLEARVVILADSRGDVAKPFEEELSVTRDQATPQGFLHVKKPLGQYVTQSLAHPPGWAAYAQREAELAEAERQRKLYVAATRARELLVICYCRGKDEGANRRNPWRDLVKHLGGASLIEPDSAREPRPKEARQRTLHRTEESALSAEIAWNTCAATPLSVPAAPTVVSALPTLAAWEREM